MAKRESFKAQRRGLDPHTVWFNSLYMSQLPRPQAYVQNVNVKHKDCRFKKTRGEEDTDEKHGRQKMPNIDGVIPAVCWDTR